MRSKVLGYVAACYLASFALGGTVALLGGPGNSSVSWLLLVNGWVPALIAVIARIVTRQGFGDTGWGLKRPGSLLLAVLPVTVFVSAAAIVAGISPFAFHPGVQLRGVGVGFGINVLVNSAFVLGEELGWRGYLQKHVLEWLGTTRGLVALSLIWSFWHLPLDWMGLGYPNMNVFVSMLVLRPMAMLGLGMLVGWVYLRTRSVWAACLVHGVNNAVGGRLGGLLDLSANQSTLVLVTVSLLYCLLGLLICMGFSRAKGNSVSGDREIAVPHAEQEKAR